MSERAGNSSKIPLGQLALQAELCPQYPPPPVHSYAYAGTRRTTFTQTHTEELYPLQYKTSGSIVDNIRFALKYEPLDLKIVVQALRALGESGIRQWMAEEPTGGYARRAWFLFEKFVHPVDLADVTTGNYVDALSSRLHYTADAIRSRRHRVNDNLLGNSELCPIVRRTRKLAEMERLDLAGETRRITAQYSQETLIRALNYLSTKETRSSFAIEGETPSPKREQRFVQALRSAAEFFPVDKEKVLKLQASIVDPRYADSDWRDYQNFVGETTHRGGENVHFICPQPQDVPGLMDGWMAMGERLVSSASPDAVIGAATVSFGFVFIHPFGDGNGRIHRFSALAFLAARRFSPDGLVLPISAAIERERREYERVLALFSQPILDSIDWDLNEDQAIIVKGDTRDFYRFYDATAQVEFLYERLIESVRTDLHQEARFLELFDQAFRAVREVVDMPNKRASLLVRLCLNNGGRLAKRRREQFAELSDAEVRQMEQHLVALVSRSDLLDSVGWSQKQVLQLFEACPESLRSSIASGLEELTLDWDSDNDVDELDNIDAFTVTTLDISDGSLDDIRLEGDRVLVKVSCELHFELTVEVTVADAEERIMDPEDRNSTLVEPPVFSGSVDEEFRRSAVVVLALRAGGAFDFVTMELEEHTLLVSRPDPRDLHSTEQLAENGAS